MSWFKYFVELARIAKAEAATNRTLRSILKVILIFGCLLVAGISLGLAMFAAFLAIFSGGALAFLVPQALLMIAVSLGLAWAIFAIRNLDIIVVVALLSLWGFSFLVESGMFPTLHKNGAYVEYYEGGQKKSEEFFDNGIEAGIWTTWHESGERNSAVAYYEGGKKKSEEFFDNGIETGIWTTWHESGERKSAVAYYEGGQKKSEEFFDNGIETGWYESGQLKFKRDSNSGSSTTWYESGQLRFKRDSNSSISTAWYEGGQLKSKHDSKSRILTTWYESGSKQSIQDRECDPFNQLSEWYENGQLKSEGYQPLKQGIFWTGENYTGGKTGTFQYGRWLTWDESGQELPEKYFVAGEPMSEAEWRTYHTQKRIQIGAKRYEVMEYYDPDLADQCMADWESPRTEVR